MISPESLGRDLAGRGGWMIACELAWLGTRDILRMYLGTYITYSSLVAKRST